METATIDRPPPTGEGLTYEKVWAMFQETDRKLQETSRIVKENAELQKENAERQKENAESWKETERILRETEKIVKENAERQKETDRQMKETDRQMKKLSKQMGNLHNRFGELAEHLVAPNIAKRFNELGFHFDSVAPGGEEIFDENRRVIAEADILLKNSDYIVAIEVKVKPDMEDIPAQIKRLGILRNYWNNKGDRRKLLGAMAGAIFPKTVKKAAAKAGLYVLVQSGDTMKIDIPEGFVPREF